MKQKAISIPINLLIILFSTVSISKNHITSSTTIKSWSVYLPLTVKSNCGVDGMINGDFEQGDHGWSLYSSGTGWKVHDLIGSISEGFSPYRGAYAARLGGYEGVWDVIAQTITIPPQGHLSYWWKMGTYENLPHHDYFASQSKSIRWQPEWLYWQFMTTKIFRGYLATRYGGSVSICRWKLPRSILVIQ